MNAIKVTPTVFCYEIIGLEKNILFNAFSRRIMVTSRIDGVILHDQDVYENLNFDEFIAFAKTLYLEMINDIQAN